MLQLVDQFVIFSHCFSQLYINFFEMEQPELYSVLNALTLQIVLRHNCDSFNLFVIISSKEFAITSRTALVWWFYEGNPQDSKILELGEGASIHLNSTGTKCLQHFLKSVVFDVVNNMK